MVCICQFFCGRLPPGLGVRPIVSGQRPSSTSSVYTDCCNDCAMLVLSTPMCVQLVNLGKMLRERVWSDVSALRATRLVCTACCGSRPAAISMPGDECVLPYAGMLPCVASSQLACFQRSIAAEWYGEAGCSCAGLLHPWAVLVTSKCVCDLQFCSQETTVLSWAGNRPPTHTGILHMPHDLLVFDLPVSSTSAHGQLARRRLCASLLAAKVNALCG